MVPPTPSAAATYKVGSRGGLGHTRSINPLKPRRHHLCRPLQPLQQKRPMWDLGLSQIFLPVKIWDKMLIHTKRPLPPQISPLYLKYFRLKYSKYNANSAHCLPSRTATSRALLRLGEISPSTMHHKICRSYFILQIQNK